MAGELWGLCLRHSVRDRQSAEAREDCDGLTATGEDDSGRQGRALSAALAPIGATAARGRITAVSRDDTICAGAVGVRCPEGRAVGRSADHEVSCRNDGREGVGRGRTLSTTMAPPQHGQRSGRRGRSVSWTWSASRSATGTSSNLRQSASFGGTVAVGEEAVVADAMEAVRQAVQQEATDELVGG